MTGEAEKHQESVQRDVIDDLSKMRTELEIAITLFPVAEELYREDQQGFLVQMRLVIAKHLAKLKSVIKNIENVYYEWDSSRDSKERVPDRTVRVLRGSSVQTTRLCPSCCSQYKMRQETIRIPLYQSLAHYRGPIHVAWHCCPICGFTTRFIRE